MTASALRGLELARQGNATKTIAAAVGVNRQTVTKWRHKEWAGLIGFRGAASAAPLHRTRIDREIARGQRFPRCWLLLPHESCVREKP